MALKNDIKAARDAVDKLQTYCEALPKNSVPTKKYNELNTKANAAIIKLPSHLRSQFALDVSRLFIQ